MGNSTSATKEALPIDTSFKLPSPLPSLPQGEGFGNGVINLGVDCRCVRLFLLARSGLQMKGGRVPWSHLLRASQMPQGFSMLGCYSQPNNRMLHGWILAGKDEKVKP
ncbi:vacuolar protein sorting-associated protein [Salix suchowensis]|nr:vacuolar protein sorting-associated protein [Salix suchowensis]